MTNLKALPCDVFFEAVSFIIYVMYTPPNYSFDILTGVFSNLEHFIKFQGNFTLAGDFNLSCVNWSDFFVGSTERYNVEPL